MAHTVKAQNIEKGMKVGAWTASEDAHLSAKGTVAYFRVRHDVLGENVWFIAVDKDVSVE